MLDKIFLFAGEHFFLVTTFIVLLGVFFYTETQRGGEALTPQGVSSLVNRENALLIDVRSGDKFREGHIHGSENVPLEQLEDEVERLKKLHDRPIILACELGNQANSGGVKLLKAGIKPVYRLKGGIEAWKGEKLPLVKG